MSAVRRTRSMHLIATMVALFAASDGAKSAGCELPAVVTGPISLRGGGYSTAPGQPPWTARTHQGSVLRRVSTRTNHAPICPRPSSCAGTWAIASFN
jgi:hypothetical protein